MTAKRINTEDKTHTITPNFRQVDVMGGYTAAAGSAFIYSDNLPARLQGMAMICEPTMKTVALFDVRRDGAGYVANDAFNLVASSDEWLSPSSPRSGPTAPCGSPIGRTTLSNTTPLRASSAAATPPKPASVAPMKILRDSSRGRIYRVVWDKSKPAAITSLKAPRPPNSSPPWAATINSGASRPNACSSKANVPTPPLHSNRQSPVAPPSKPSTPSGRCTASANSTPPPTAAHSPTPTPPSAATPPARSVAMPPPFPFSSPQRSPATPMPSPNSRPS